MYGLLFSQVCIKLQQWWLYPKIPQKPSATEKKRAARWEPWRTPALESLVLFRQDMEASKKNPSRSGEAKSQCWTAPGITTSISRCVKREKEKEKEGRKQLGATLQHCNILLPHGVSNITSTERETQRRIPAQALTLCGTLGESLKLSETSREQCWTGDTNITSQDWWEDKRRLTNGKVLSISLPIVGLH